MSGSRSATASSCGSCGRLRSSASIYRFQSLAEAHRIIDEFIARYNTEWRIVRLGYQTPVAARAAALAA
jgi:transposase InsO family protein